MPAFQETSSFSPVVNETLRLSLSQKQTEAWGDSDDSSSEDNSSSDDNSGDSSSDDNNSSDNGPLSCIYAKRPRSTVSLPACIRAKRPRTVPSLLRESIPHIGSEGSCAVSLSLLQLFPNLTVEDIAGKLDCYGTELSKTLSDTCFAAYYYFKAGDSWSLPVINLLLSPLGLKLKEEEGTNGAWNMIHDPTGTFLVDGYLSPFYTDFHTGAVFYHADHETPEEGENWRHSIAIRHRRIYCMGVEEGGITSLNQRTYVAKFPRPPGHMLPKSYMSSIRKVFRIVVLDI